MTPVRRHGSQGFTLLELIVVVAIVALAAFIGFPALQNMIHRSKVQGALTQIATEARAARLESIKESVQYYLQADFTKDRLVVWRESGMTVGFSPADDTEVRSVALPQRVYFWGPLDASAEGPDAIRGLFPERHLTLRPDGTSDINELTAVPPDGASFRIADERGNFLEVRIGPPTTSRVQLRKWDGTDFRSQGEQGKAWKWL